ncbi:MAG: hydrogenase maturation protease [Actinomycetota bacterium]|nr:hydrogenase maturation protease [Actinomycetota bacterium]
MRGVLVGGIGQLYQGDHDLGRRVAERLQQEALGPAVVVEEMHYGAVAVGQLLDDLRPDLLVLVGTTQRGHPPGTVSRRHVSEFEFLPSEAQDAVASAVTGYVTIDLVLEVASGLGGLPARTVVIEVEPARTDPSEHLSPEAERALEEALELARAEVGRAPLLVLADRLRGLVAEAEDRLEPTPALEALEELLGELEILEREGRWAGTFAARDRLRLRIATGQTGEGMTHLDWSLWWNLIEELDRLQPLEAVRGLDR